MDPRLEAVWQASQPWLLLLLLLAFAVVAGMVFDRVVVAWLRRAVRRSATELDDVLVEAVHPAIGVFVGVLVFHGGLAAASRFVPPTFVSWWGRILLALAILLGGVMVARAAAGLLRHGASRQPRFHAPARVGARVLAVTVYIVAFLVVLDTYGVSITPLVTSLGIAGLAVALALQDTLSNFFAGVWIQTSKALLPGHFVRLEEQKLDGFVVEVGWRTTKIRQLSNNLVIVPNAKVAQAIMIDYDLPEPRMGANITLLVDLDTDVEKALGILLEEAKTVAGAGLGMLDDPPPAANLKDITENGLLLWLGFQVREFVAQFGVQNELRLRILKRFREEGIRLARPRRDVRITETARP